MVERGAEAGLLQENCERRRPRWHSQTFARRYTAPTAYQARQSQLEGNSNILLDQMLLTPGLCRCRNPTRRVCHWSRPLQALHSPRISFRPDGHGLDAVIKTCAFFFSTLSPFLFLSLSLSPSVFSVCVGSQTMLKHDDLGLATWVYYLANYLPITESAASLHQQHCIFIPSLSPVLGSVENHGNRSGRSRQLPSIFGHAIWNIGRPFWLVPSGVFVDPFRNGFSPKLKFLFIQCLLQHRLDPLLLMRLKLNQANNLTIAPSGYSPVHARIRHNNVSIRSAGHIIHFVFLEPACATSNSKPVKQKSLLTNYSCLSLSR